MILADLAPITWDGIVVIGVAVLGGIPAYVSIQVRLAQLRATADEGTRWRKEYDERMDRLELEKMQERVNTLWMFQMRRGRLEVTEKGLGEFHSPLELGEVAKQAIAPMEAELKRWYRNEDGDRWSMPDFIVNLEKNFGERLTEEVCPAAGVDHAGCWWIAASVLRPMEADASEEWRKELQDMQVSTLPPISPPCPPPGHMKFSMTQN